MLTEVRKNAPVAPAPALPETPPEAWLDAMDEATCNEDAMFMELFDRHERKDIMRAAYAALRAALAEEKRDG